MKSKRQLRAFALAVWVALLLLLAAAILPSTDLGATLSAHLAKVFARSPTLTPTPVRPAPTPTLVHLFPIQAAIGQPADIVASPDGHLWLTFPGGIARADVEVSGVTVTPFPVASGVAGICAGPDGAVWFTEENSGKIGRMAVDGSIREFPLPNSDEAGDITTGPDGALWFTLPHAIGRMTTAGSVTTFPLPAPDAAGDLTAGPDGAIWFLDSRSARIGRMTQAGSVTEFAVPSGSEDLYGLVAGPDGALWFTEGPYDTVDRITTSGQVTEYPAGKDGVGQIDWLTGITVGPDKALWFAESASHRIGRMTTGGKVTDTYHVSSETKLGAFLAITATNNAIWFTVPDQQSIGCIDTGFVTGGVNDR